MSTTEQRKKNTNFNNNKPKSYTHFVGLNTEKKKSRKFNIRKYNTK